MKGFKSFTQNVLSDIVVWIIATLENRYKGIKQGFTNYAKETFLYSFKEHFFFKNTTKNVFIKMTF